MKKKDIIDFKRIKDELTDEIENLVGKKEFNEFKKFAFKGHMIQMAIAFMLGAAFNSVIKGLSDNIIMPCLNYVINITGTDWREATYSPIEGLVLETGKFSGAFVDFLIISIIFFIVWQKIIKPIEAEIPKIECIDTIECPYCLGRAHYQASKCSKCASWLDNPYAKVKHDSRRQN
jgi:large conductance mechanosensitive channel